MACEDGSTCTPPPAAPPERQTSRRSPPIIELLSQSCPFHFTCLPAHYTAYSRVNLHELYHYHSYSKPISANSHSLIPDLPPTSSTVTAMPYNNTPIAPSKEVSGTVSLPRMCCPALPLDLSWKSTLED